MGLKSSPHNSVQGAQRAKRLILGNPTNLQNPFCWTRVVQNLPGSSSYNPTLPWIRKVRHDGLSASDLISYVDDMREMAATEELACLCSSRVAKTLAFLGLQDAARKRRKPSQTPGAWAGATVTTTEGRVCKSVTQERWEKLQAHIRWIGQELYFSDGFTSDVFCFF